jgi:tRNA threonylcarbamoyladenosine biosynthesis protein TsaB
MKLSIDTSDNKKTVVRFDDLELTEEYGQPREQRLLEVIEQGLKQRGAKVADITAIEVNLGPGSFTGLRVGCTVANTLGWLLKVPINGKKAGELAEPEYEK